MTPFGARVSRTSALLDFLQTTYDAAADLALWDRAALECALGEPRRVRPV